MGAAGADKSKRGPYRPDQGEALARIEARRTALGITVDQLADRAAIDRRTLQRIRRSQLAFPRQINALRMALRTLEREQKAAGALFPVGGTL